MRTFPTVLLSLLISTSLAAAADDIDRPGKGEWCYDPVHSATDKEQEKFVTDILTAARRAEKKYGVPAPILTAMAIVESGYGLTRIALKSNNVFAFKWPGEKLGTGYQKFVLWCQPDWDEGNTYPAFKKRADAVEFVARRLSESTHYKRDTEVYKNAVAAGADRKTASIEWLRGIADPYNYDPSRYVAMILGKARNPIKGTVNDLWEMSYEQ